MKTIALKNGTIIFVEQIAFIHIQPSISDEIQKPEIHVHFSAALSGPKGARSMRTVIGKADSLDFMEQLEKHGVECAHMRNRLVELSK